MATAKYCLKSDRSKVFEVQTPVYSVAALKGSDGKTFEVNRGEFDEKYEPLLTPVNPGTIPSAAADDRIDRLITHVGILTQRVTDMQTQLGQVHAIVVPPPEKTNTGS